MSIKSLQSRLEECQIPVVKKLLGIMIEKKTNLCVAADFKTFDEVLRFIEKAGKHIAVLKTHCAKYPGDLSKNLSILYEKKREHRFLLFDDPKFYDCKEVIEDLYRAHYAKYADLVTLVPINPGIFEAIRSAVKSLDLPEDEHRGCLAVCEVSFADTSNSWSTEFLKRAEENAPICAGIVAQSLKCSNKSMIKATPGVRIDKTSDAYQQWRHPLNVLADGADLIIVGRGITTQPEEKWEDKVIEYKEVCFNAYFDLVNK